MLNKQELVNFINEKLNEINSNYKFNIMAEVGETKPGVFSGILLTNRAETANIPGYDEINYSFTVAILVPSARTNKKLLQVENIIGEFCNTYDATEQVFGETDVTLTITPGKPDNLRTEFEIGDCVPLYFTINGLWGNNVTSTKKHWFLDGVEIPFESEGVYLQKDGRTNKIQGIYNTQTLPTGVTKQYKFTFPYSSNFSGLQQDLLSGDFKKIYTLTYYDGVSYTEESPFSAKVSIFASGDNNSARTRTAKFNITFTDVDDGNTTVKYYLALIDNPFDNQTEDTRWFNSQIEQQAYYEDKVTNGCQYEQIKAPNLNSLDITSQVYENTQGYDMLSLVNKNYAIIKITQNNQDAKYLYYFVQSCQIGADNQYLYDLKLDTIQTYLFNPDLQFSDCFIEKANLNRWIEDDEYELLTSILPPINWDNNYTSYYVKVGDDYVQNTNSVYEANKYYSKTELIRFDGTLNSKLFIREDFQNLPKRLTNRRYISLSNTMMSSTSLDETVTPEVKQWLDEHIQCWLYMYVDSTKEYCIYNSTSGINDSPVFANSGNILPKIIYETSLNEGYSTNLNGTIPSNTTCLCVPIYKQNYGISLYGALKTRCINENNIICDTIINSVGLEGFINTGRRISGTSGDAAKVYPYVIATKISYLPPSLGNVNCFISGNDLIIEGTWENLEHEDGWDATLNKPKYVSGGTAVKLSSSNNIAYSIRTNVLLNQTNWTYCGMIIPVHNEKDNIIENISSDKEYVFYKTNIVGKNKNSVFNPKLLGTDFCELKISDTTEDGYSYDLQKLNLEEFNLITTQPLVADITKTYIRIDTTNSPIYGQYSKNNLIGFVGSNDTTLVIPKDAYSNMIANNKNFFLQNSTNRGFDIANGILGLATGGFSALVGGTTAKYGAELSTMKASSAAGALGAGASAGLAGAGAAALFAGQAVGKIGSMLINNIQSKTNEKFTVDNLKNAPGSVQGAQGNVIFENMYSDFGVIVENWDALPNDKEIANDYMVRYGFNTNLIGNPFDYLNNSNINGRHYFNYIKAQIQNISGVPMSNVARADIRERFDNGIRFWNSDTIDYSKENYEQWLDPIQTSRVVLNKTRVEYNHALQEVEVETVYDVDNHIVPRNSYTISGTTEAINAGTYTVTVTGTGMYKGTATATWEIYDNGNVISF